MEHLESTQIVRTTPLRDAQAYDALLALTSHEYFHVWNVKRLRPVELGPWDYTKETHTRVSGSARG